MRRSIAGLRSPVTKSVGRLQLPQISTVERRVGGGGIGHEVRSQFRPLLFYQLRSSGLWELIETPFPTHAVHERSQTGLQAPPRMPSVCRAAIAAQPSPTDVRESSGQTGGSPRTRLRTSSGWSTASASATYAPYGVPHEMRGSGFQLRDQRSQIRNVIAERIDVCLSWWSVGREETPAVGDDPEARCERLHLLLKGVQISQGTMNEDERLSLTALEVVERGLIDLDRADVGATRFRLTLCVREGSRARAASIKVSMRREGATVIRIMSYLPHNYGCLMVMMRSILVQHERRAAERVFAFQILAEFSGRYEYLAHPFSLDACEDSADKDNLDEQNRPSGRPTPTDTTENSHARQLAIVLERSHQTR